MFGCECCKQCLYVWECVCVSGCPTAWLVQDCMELLLCARRSFHFNIACSSTSSSSRWRPFRDFLDKCVQFLSFEESVEKTKQTKRKNSVVLEERKKDFLFILVEYFFFIKKENKLLLYFCRFSSFFHFFFFEYNSTQSCILLPFPVKMYSFFANVLAYIVLFSSKMTEQSVR